MRLHPYSSDQYEHRKHLLESFESDPINRPLLEIRQAAALLEEFKVRDEKAFSDSGLTAIHARLAIINPESRAEMLAVFDKAREVCIPDPSVPGEKWSSEAQQASTRALHFAQVSKTFEKETILAYRALLQNAQSLIDQIPPDAVSNDHRKWFVKPARDHMIAATQFLDQILKINGLQRGPIY